MITTEIDAKHLRPLVGIVERSKPFGSVYATVVSVTAKEAGTG
jgi:hypothetical protein